MDEEERNRHNERVNRYGSYAHGPDLMIDEPRGAKVKRYAKKAVQGAKAVGSGLYRGATAAGHFVGDVVDGIEKAKKSNTAANIKRRGEQLGQFSQDYSDVMFGSSTPKKGKKRNRDYEFQF